MVVIPIDPTEMPESFGQMPSALAAPSDTSLPDVEPGHVVLFINDNWQSEQLDLTIDTGRGQDIVHSFKGTDLAGEATWVAFNLPVGTVVTLTEQVQGDAVPPNWHGYGRTVDCVGTGSTVAIDLKQCNANDCLKGYNARTVDPGLGYVEMYEDKNFKKNRTVIFFDDFNGVQVSSDFSLDLAGWFMSGKLSSLKWGGGTEAAKVSLTDERSSFDHMFVGADRTESDLKDYDFNDKRPTLVVSRIRPAVASVKNVDLSELTMNVGERGVIQTVHADGHTPGNGPYPTTFHFELHDEESLTSTVSNSYKAGAELTVTYSVLESLEVSATVSFDYTRTDSNETTTTRGQITSLTTTHDVPEAVTLKLSLIARRVAVSGTAYIHQRAGYTQRLANTELENGYWYRDEVIPMQVTGSLLTEITFYPDIVPWDGGTATGEAPDQSIDLDASTDPSKDESQSVTIGTIGADG